jgi:hypothetical protein
MQKLEEKFRKGHGEDQNEKEDENENDGETGNGSGEGNKAKKWQLRHHALRLPYLDNTFEISKNRYTCKDVIFCNS